MTSATLKIFTRAHRRHHGLTHIVRKGGSTTGGAVPIQNRYPITDASQHEASFFPYYYALTLFVLTEAPLFISLQWMFPGAPILLGGITALLISYVLYEILHAIEHLSYETWWKKKVEHPVFGKLWTSIYGFHQMHHVNTGCNEAISGFFGLPLADWLFGTYKQPHELPLPDRLATEEDFRASRPMWLIRWLDVKAENRERAVVARQRV